MKPIVYLLAIFVAMASINADALTKAAKKKIKKPRYSKTTQQVVPPSAIAIGYPSIIIALNAVKESNDAVVKPNAKPFGWQERSGPWYVMKEGKNIEWAFTEGGHYAHPSLVKRMIDVGSADHVYVDMAFRCGAPSKRDCEKLLAEFKEVNLLIRKVYQKKYIVSADGLPAWNGADSLE